MNNQEKLLLISCTALMISGLSTGINLDKKNKEVERLNTELIQTIDQSNKDKIDLEKEIENLKIEISKKEILNKKLNSKKEISKPTRGTKSTKGNFQATAYCKCTKCCGKWTNSPTASGTTPKAGRTIAVDPNVIPLGSRVLVNGKEYRAEDTGSKIKGNIVDIFHNTHQEALNFGRQTVQVEVLD